MQTPENQVLAPGAQASAAAARTFLTGAGWTALAVWGLAASFYYLRAAAAPHAFACDNVIMGADAQEIMAGLSSEGFGYDAFKRPLFSILTGAPIAILRWVFGAPAVAATQGVLALWAGAATAVVYVICRRHFGNAVVSALAAACFALSFAPATLFSIPETYGVTSAVAALFILAMLERSRMRVSGSVRESAALGAALAAAMFTYPPLILLGVVWLALSWPRVGPWRAARGSTIALAVALVLYYGGLLAVFGPDTFGAQGRYIDRFGALERLLHWETYASVASVFFAQALVAPHDSLQPAYGLADWLGYAGRPLALASLCIVGVLYAALVSAIARRARRETAVVGLTVYAALLTLFFAFFNSTEAMLYAPLAVLPIWLMIAWSSGRNPRAAVLLALCAVCFAAVNVSPLAHTPPCPASEKKARKVAPSGLSEAGLSGSITRPRARSADTARSPTDSLASPRTERMSR